MRIVLAFLFSGIMVTTSAQTPDTVQHWKRRINASVGINQASFSSNWSAGGVNSIGLNTALNLKQAYRKGHISWDTEMDLAYGFIRNDEIGTRKAVDRLLLDTKCGYELNGKWNVFASLNLLSQFAKGFKFEKDSAGTEVKRLVSDTFAPAYITSALGLEYKPSESFRLRISPMAPRITIVNDVGRFAGPLVKQPYGVEPPHQTRIEPLALQLLAVFDKKLAENIVLNGRYLLFANYETLQLKTIDHQMDLNFIAKVTRYINVSLGGRLLYDYDQDDQMQLSQALTMGLAITLQNYADKKP